MTQGCQSQKSRRMNRTEDPPAALRGHPCKSHHPGQVFLHVTFSFIAWKVSSLKKLVLSSWIKSTRLWNVTGYINHTPWQVPRTEDDPSQGQGIKFHTTWSLVVVHFKVFRAVLLHSVQCYWVKFLQVVFVWFFPTLKSILSSSDLGDYWPSNLRW